MFLPILILIPLALTIQCCGFHVYAITNILYLIPKILVFQGAGRGMVASESIGVGDIALEIPERLIISQELLCQSEVVCSHLLT
jgi:hypothetical protein